MNCKGQHYKFKGFDRTSQPLRPINEISVRREYLPGKCLSVRGIGVSWKIICVRVDRTSWKINMFDDKIEAPGKFNESESCPFTKNR